MKINFVLKILWIKITVLRAKERNVFNESLYFSVNISNTKEDHIYKLKEQEKINTKM